ncbi:MAG: hypothetical protein ACE5F6_06955 [Anaerolineae bacterium]
MFYRQQTDVGRAARVAGSDEVPGRRRQRRGMGRRANGRRQTRDGRTPFMRQQYLAQALGMPQPSTCAGASTSRIEGY